MEPILIVSAFGRGLWLAQALKSRNIEVSFVDVTKELGDWSELDIAGPFPFLKSATISDEQWDFWSVHARPKEIPQGLTVLLGEGPLEFRSNYFPMRAQKLGIKNEILDILLHETESPSHQRFLGERLRSVWPLVLAHHWMAPVDFSPLESLQFARSHALRSPCFIAQSSVLQDGILNLSQKTEVIFDQSVDDLSIAERKKVTGVLLKKERSELKAASQTVWALTASETKFISDKCSEKIFNKEEKLFYRSWMRWTFHLQGPTLPAFLLMIQDVELPWNYENFFSLIFDAETGNTSVWCLMPTEQRFHESYITEKTKIIHQSIQRRLVDWDCKLISEPKELSQTFKTLGPSLFGVMKEGLFYQSQSKLKNRIHYLSSDVCWGQDAVSFFDLEQKVLNSTLDRWNKDLEIKNKKEMRAAARG